LRNRNDAPPPGRDTAPYPVENLAREVIDTVREQEQEVRE
jgi:hypothetical protein